MTTEAKETLSVGDSVYLANVPGDAWTIVASTVNKGQWLVASPRGKTWIFHSSELVRVES